MKQIEDGMRRTATRVAAAFGATAEVDLPDVWAQLVNDPTETKFIADVRPTSWARRIGISSGTGPAGRGGSSCFCELRNRNLGVA
jgi:hypothetical protein